MMPPRFEQRLLKVARGVTRAMGVYRIIIITLVFWKIVFAYLRQRSPAEGVPVAVIDHNFIQDIDALKRQAASAGINLIAFWYEPFYKLAEQYFPEHIRDGSYLTVEMQECARRYRRLLVLLLAVWRPWRSVSCLLMPSDSFFWIRELVVLLKEYGIPCVVIDKEGTISPHSMEFHSRQISERYPFISDYIIVWSERQKAFWMRTGVVEEKIFIAGQPRSDFFFDRDAWLPKKQLPCGDKHMVLFFTFETDAYAPVPGDHIWSELRNDLHSELIALAGRYPEICFVVKTHPQQADRFAVEREFAASALSNIKVLHGPEIARHLIVHADLVIGFQTTALIEAMLAEKRVIYTEWSKEVCANQHHLIPFQNAAGIDIVRSRQEFSVLVDGTLRQHAFAVADDTMDARKRFVDIFIPNADGNASRRVMLQVKKIIAARNGISG
jgi:hypothetical protein